METKFRIVNECWGDPIDVTESELKELAIFFELDPDELELRYFNEDDKVFGEYYYDGFLVAIERS